MESITGNIIELNGYFYRSCEKVFIIKIKIKNYYDQRCKFPSKKYF